MATVKTPTIEVDGMMILFETVPDGFVVVGSWAGRCPRCETPLILGCGIDSRTGAVTEIEVENECGCPMNDRESKLLFLRIPTPLRAVLVELEIWDSTPWGESPEIARLSA